jgi:cyclase
MKTGNINMYYDASKLLFQRAEELRKYCTREEETIWSYLPGNKLGVKFSRQHPLLFYIADFYCHQVKLVIEIDGGVHNKEAVKISDAIRQKEIGELGITVLRFNKEEIKTM